MIYILIGLAILGLILYNHRYINIYKIMTRLSIVVTFGSLVILVLFILKNGIPSMSMDLFRLNYTSENLSMMPFILTTLALVALGLCIAVPIGIFTSIYLVEYAKESSGVSIIRLVIDTLQGIPSIVYGLFGMMFFVEKMGNKFGFSFSILAGGLTISIMILPVIIKTVEEALLAVPSSVRMGSYALGAGKMRTIFQVVLPEAMPGIISAIILATGRILGETAALQFTLGTATLLPTSIFRSSRTLSVHMHVLSSEGLHVGEAYATATVLLLLVMLVNYLSKLIGKRMTDVN